MGEPGGLPSVGSHRVGHDRSDLAAATAAATQLEITVPNLCIVQRQLLKHIQSSLGIHGGLALINSFPLCMHKLSIL